MDDSGGKIAKLNTKVKMMFEQSLLIPAAIAVAVTYWIISKLAASGLAQRLHAYFSGLTANHAGSASSATPPGSEIDPIAHLLLAQEAFVRGGQMEKAAKVAAILTASDKT